MRQKENLHRITPTHTHHHHHHHHHHYHPAGSIVIFLPFCFLVRLSTFTTSCIFFLKASQTKVLLNTFFPLKISPYPSCCIPFTPVCSRETKTRILFDVFSQIDSELFLAPGFPVPPNSDYDAYHLYIDEELPPESPYLYGLHPNAEIEFLTKTSDNLLKTVFEMQPRDASGDSGESVSKDDKV